MNVIVCIDDAGGMLFNGCRQSKDKILRQQARKLAQDQPLWMNGYSASQFVEDGCEIIVDEAFLDKAPEDGWCFVENCDLLPFLKKIRQVAVYRWNRLYPSDVKFPMAVLDHQFRLAGRREFPGKSHDMITEEIYTL